MRRILIVCIALAGLATSLSLRINYGTMTNELALDDPGAFSRPVNLKFTARALPPGEELMEFICTENNQYGPAGTISNIDAEQGYGLEVVPT